jgi:multiple sugar transport system substrate-binding protein
MCRQSAAELEECRPMRRQPVAVVAVLALIASACSNTGSSPSAAPASAGASAESMAPSAAESMSAAPSGSEMASASAGASASGGSADYSGISGTATLSGWQSSPAEGAALTSTLQAFAGAYPNVKISYAPVAGDYPTVMATKFASGDVPDIFYVNADTADAWISQGFLAPLDDYVSKYSFDTSQFYDGYASIFKGSDGKTYGFPKDGNTIAMAYNSDAVTTAPTTLDELTTAAQALKGKDGMKAPICANPGLDRGLAFLYAQGGSLLTADGKSSAIDTDASKAAVQWYLDLFKNGLAMTASDLGDSWCGDSLGKKHVGIIFEGGWLDASMKQTYPDVKYGWAQFPTGSSGSPVTISFTAAYAIGADAKNKDQAWVALQYLTGKDGMTEWTKGGVALPSRKDVPPPSGTDVLVNSSAFAKPGSGFMPGYNDVQKAFQDAFTAQVQKKTFDAGAVVTATKAAIDKALAGS